MRPFFVTTPIYYVNDKPHIGHAYTTVAADVFARTARLEGRPTRFLTGTDEHGQKIEGRAKELGQSPQAFVDAMSPPFKEAFQQLRCSFDDYIRTTEPRHEEAVARLWKTLEERGDIFLGEYEGWYSVADEAFITETELKELDEVTRSKVQRVREKSYFFKLSAYADKLLEFYDKNPNFVTPEGRFNEVKSFVREGLRDLSVSRTSFRWGIPVPGDAEHVMYVWLDALTNYISALGGPAAKSASPLFDEFWAPNAEVVHVLGKDILRFHAIYWPAFLLAAGIQPPTQIVAHGWLTINGEKMSKRFGNFIPPGPLCDAFGPDVVRYYLMREVGFGQDGDFSHKQVLARYHGELGNSLGNLLNRILSGIVHKTFSGKLPSNTLPAGDDEATLIALTEKNAALALEQLHAMEPHRALDSIFAIAHEANRYVDKTAPWALAKNGELPRLAQVVSTVAETLRFLGTMLWPFMPERMNELRRQLGLAPLDDRAPAVRWPVSFGNEETLAGNECAQGAPLFPRFDEKAEAEILERLAPASAHPPGSIAQAQLQAKTQPQSPPRAMTEETTASDNTITFDDFMKVELKVGLVLSAEEVPKSSKLVRCQIDLGEASPRQVLAGIREYYEPAALVGKRVVVVANLAPRKMMGQESHGMILAVKDEGGLGVVSMERDVPPGTRVS